MKRAVFEFAPISRKQRQILNWWVESSPVKDAEGIIADGAIRSGKTLMMSLSFISWSMEHFSGQNFAMCGKTIGSFRRNVLAVLKQVLPGRGYTLEDKRADNLLIVSRNGAENYYYLFGGKDEKSQDLIQGITLAGVFLDEVALMPRSFVEQAMARCSVDGSKLWFNCNPAGPEHWFYKEWVLKAAERHILHLHFTMDDNLSLSAAIRARYASLYVGVFFRRYILGEWCLAEGLIYGFFDRAKHTTSEIPKHGRYFISIDYGTMNPFSAGLWCYDGERAVRIREYYYDGRGEGETRTDEEYYSELEKLAGDVPIESIVIDPSASSFIATIRRHGRFAVRRAKNDVINGIRETAGMLHSGRILIHVSCEDAIREFGLYSWDEKSTEDKPVKANDHAMDDIRYFCYTIMRRMR